MSHEIAYYVNMSVKQLLREYQQTTWARDRQSIEAVLNYRRETDAATYATTTRQMQTLQNSNRRLESSLAAARTELRNTVTASNNRIEAMRTEQAEQIQNVVTQYRENLDEERKKRERTASELLSTMQHEIQNSEQNMRREMQVAISRNQQQMQQALHTAVSGVESHITQFRQKAEARFGTMEAQLRTIDGWINGMTNNAAELRESATGMLTAAQSVIRNAQEYNTANGHNWQEGHLPGLNQMIRNTENDIRGGDLMAGTACAGARALLQDALQYRERVMEDEMKWQTALALAVQSIDEAQGTLTRNSRIHYEGGEELDVDYWTCGEIVRIRNNMDHLSRMLKDPAMTVEQLNAIRELAEQYSAQIENATLYAIQAMQQNNDRQDLLNNAVYYIEEKMPGFHVVWREHYGNDERLGTRVSLVSSSGASIVITAEPAQNNGTIQNSFRYEILSHGSDIHNAAHAVQLNRELAQYLSKLEGCEFETPRCANGSEQECARDVGQSNMNNWRNAPVTAAVQTRAALQQPSPAPAAAIPAAQSAAAAG